MPKLNKKLIDKLDQPGTYRDSELKGFLVRVRRRADGTLSKTYLVNNRVRGVNKVVSVTIGKHGLVASDYARSEARRILAEMKAGHNPNAEVREKKKKIRKEAERAERISKLEKKTLLELMYDYLRMRKLKPNSARGYELFLRRCVPDWLNMPITKITRDMVQERHVQISKEHPAQANSTFRILRALFKFAMAIYEDDQGKPLLVLNPVDRLRHARLWNRDRRRQRVIRNGQLAGWYQSVCKVRADARDILLLEVFTGLRHSEAVSLRWSNVDFEHGTILIPDTKNRTDHMIPMSSYLLDLMSKRHCVTGGGIWVFPGGGKSGHITEIRDSIKFVVHDSGVEFSEHDLRRTFETVAESLDISYYTLKRLLNHKTGSDPTAGYIITSAERLRVASQRVADALAGYMGMTAPENTGNVVQLRRRSG